MNVSTWFSDKFAKLQFEAEKIDIYSDMADAIDDQESIQSILIKRMQRARKSKKPIAVLYEKWLRGMEKGVSLPQAAKPDLKPFDFMVLSTFDEAGKLQEGMRFLSESLGKLQEAKSAMKSALVAPGIVMIMAIAMVLMFSLYAVPLIVSIYEPSKWPTIGKMLYAVSQVIKNYGILIFIVITGLIFSIIYSMDKLTGSARKKMDQLPIYKTYRQVNGLNALVGLASQLKVGVSLVESLRVVGQQSSRYMSWKLNEIQSRLAVQPDEFGRAFDVGLYDDEILYRLMDFSERSSFPEAIEKVGLQSFEKVTKGIKESSKVMGGVATAFAGVTIAFLIVAFLFTAQGIQKDVQSQVSNQTQRK